MTSRKVPVPRSGGGNRGGSAARKVSRPGVNTDGGGSNFQSPYQPPAALPDLEADVMMMDPNAWHLVYASGAGWRVKVPSPTALAALNQLVELRGAAQVQAMNEFIARHMHPDDFAVMLERMVDPDDDFKSDHYQELYRHVVTAGTSRPFSQCSGSPELPRIPGAPCAPSSLPPAYPRRFKL